MATTYNWTIANLESKTADGGVVVAHWRVTAEETVGEDTYTATAYGTMGFTPDASAPDFVPYASLTEADVLAWVYAQGDTWKADTESNLATQIEEQKTPATQSGLPWQSEE
jgi:hypothetical protein